MMFLRRGVIAIAVLGALTAGCDDPAPIKIGFLGGMSGRVADLGISGRNGALLAIEQQNSAGGIGGRKIQMIVRDDKQDPGTARAAINEFIDKRVTAVIGPMTSVIGVTIVPLVNEARMVLVSPTVTTKALTGKDDYFFRVLAHTKSYAQIAARFHRNTKKLTRIAAIYDARNAAYTKSWLDDFRGAFEKIGGKIVGTVSFRSGTDRDFADMARRALDTDCEGVLILSNSVDGALLMQRLRSINRDVHILTSEWAGTERLIELGGRATEGAHVGQFIDRLSDKPSFVSFQRAYVKRFGEEPGFAGMAGYDAANLLIASLAATAGQGGETLKRAILRIGSFAGAQETVRIDRFGDSNRTTFMTTVRNGKFYRVD